jgi:phage-related protein
MLMKNSSSFTFNGISSTNFGIINASVSGSWMREETFIHERKIEETKIRGRSKPYLRGIEREKLEFDIELAFEESFDNEVLNNVADWLCLDYYAPMVFTENPDRVFFCMLEGKSSLFYINNRGYLKLHFVCDDAYVYSPIYQTKKYTTGSEYIAGAGTNETTINITGHGMVVGGYITNATRDNAVRQVLSVTADSITIDSISGQTSGDIILTYSSSIREIEILNQGVIPIAPSFEIINKGSSPIRIKNITDEGKELIFTDISIGETIGVDGDNEIIVTDKPNTWRYDNCNLVFFKLLRGVNRIQLIGDFDITWKYTYRYYS